MSTFTKTETTENAIEGTSVDGRGVIGRSTKNYGMRAHSKESAGIRGSSDEGRGVEGWSIKTEGVVGISTNGHGVWGQTEGAGIGVLGTSSFGSGVAGRSQKATGVRGDSTDGRGVEGASTNAYGVTGFSQKSAGIRGDSAGGRGVEGWSTDHEGVVGISTNSTGVWGQTDGAGHGVVGTSKNGVGIYGRGGRLAGFFEGSVVVTGDISLANGDCAEDFEIAAGSSAEPGTVMVLDDESSLRESVHPYDKRVAGVIAGAGSYKPGIVLDRQQGQGNRKPIALLGKVFCKADAQFGSIGVGDLLTTSPTPGFAMRVDDPLKAFGAVIGKALRPLAVGQGLIPILITLQ
jgi:hypothetical protein